uniref:Septin-type G domain-containing protein n=1 Tax=Gadus morhua TaxID=8049 RepID=A0A8C4ZNB8_GADMO
MQSVFAPPPKRLAEAVKKEGKKIEVRSGTLEVYTLPLEAQPMEIEGCKCFMFGKDFGRKNRTIMVLGATGAGKSTMVNRMINYILGVTWDDTFRFKLVDEGTAKSQAHSQTSEVTVYKLNHREGFQIDYSLTIVDTPGFGDTRGIERDGLIMSQLEHLFSAKSGISEIDAICFVVQASLARLTTTQKCCFDSVLRIFGKDVAENIRILVTFADHTKPVVLGAINEFGVPCPKTKNGLPIHFKFNNSIPGAYSQRRYCKVCKSCWDMGTKNMKEFFSDLKVIETKSLTLTKEVLRQRAQLEISIENIQMKVKLALTKFEEIKKESQILQAHESAIADNKKFDYEVSVTRPVKVKTEKYSMNCEECNTAFTWSGKCKECKGECPPTKHAFKAFYWGSETVKEKRTYEELKEKYETASKKAMSVGDIIKQMELEHDHLEDEVVKLMERSAKCRNTLKEIALRPDPISTADYIDLLIEGEKSEAKPGYLERINKLQDLKKKATTTGEVASGATADSILRPDSPLVKMFLNCLSYSAFAK